MKSEEEVRSDAQTQSQSQTQVRPQAQPLSGSVPESSHQIIVNSRLAILPASTARASAVAVATRAR